MSGSASLPCIEGTGTKGALGQTPYDILYVLAQIYAQQIFEIVFFGVS